MNCLDTARRVLVVKALVEGMSLRGTARVTGVARMTIEKLLKDLGKACSEYQDKTLRHLTCKRVQCDEIWSFIGMKDKNVPAEKRGQFGWGSVWTWTAIDADTKLIPSWFVGARDAQSAFYFIEDLASRLSSRIQLTTDGHRAYLSAVEDAFGANIDYAMLVKIYGPSQDSETRYSPPECIGAVPTPITGDPDPKHISTSYVERQNLTMRMHMRRFTRLTNGHSKNLENHCHSLALHYMFYNFARIHETLGVTPAMAAGVTGKLWEVEDIVALLDSPR